MSSRRLGLAFATYGTLALVAVLWAFLRGDLDLFHHPEPWIGIDPIPGSALSVALGAFVAMVTLVATRWLVKRAEWARALHREFREILGPLRSREIALFALSSGIAEELLFRGAMQPTLGWVLASVIFGAVHIGPARRFVPWTLWAAVMGLAFGAIYQATGSLLGPIVAHVAINYENMHFITAYDPGPERPRPGIPPLVVTRVRVRP